MPTPVPAAKVASALTAPVAAVQARMVMAVMPVMVLRHIVVAATTGMARKQAPVGAQVESVAARTAPVTVVVQKARAGVRTEAATVLTEAATARPMVRVAAAAVEQLEHANTVTQRRLLAKKPSVVADPGVHRAQRANPAVADARTVKSNSVGDLSPKGASLSLHPRTIMAQVLQRCFLVLDFGCTTFARALYGPDRFRGPTSL